jgi:hypothetical protein
MAIKKTIEIDVIIKGANGGLEDFKQNFNKTEEAVKSLKTQLKEAQIEVATLSDKFGATSKEAVEAAKRAADLKDRIGDAASLTDAFNPDAKFRALTQSLNGVVGGFSVVTGLMGTLGVESKEVEGAILKVQSAMAIASGAQAIGESIDSFKQLGAVVRSFSIVQKISAAAQMVWNAAMAANPIGAIVAVVVALISAGYALVNMFISSSEATKKAEAANKALNKELDNTVKSQKAASQEAELARDLQLRMAEASGKSASEVRKLAVELANQEVRQKMANAQTLRAIAIEAMRVAGMEDATDAEKETAKNALKEFNDANEAFKASVFNRKKLLNDNRIAEKQEATDKRKELKEKQEKDNEDDKTKLKEQIDALKDLEKKYAEDIENLGDKTDAQKLETEKERALKELEEIKLSDAKKAKAKELLLKDFQIKEQELATSHADKLLALTNKLEDDKNALLAKTDEQKLKISQENAMKQLELDLKEINASATEIQKAKIKLQETFALQDSELKIAKEDEEWLRLQESTMKKSEYEKLVLTQKYEQEYIAAEGNAVLQTALKKKLEKDLGDIDKKAKEEAIEKEQALLSAKSAFAQQGLSLVSEIAGKGSKIGKAVAVAQATISGIEGVQNAYTTAQKSPITIGFPAYPVVQASLAGVFAALQIRKILSTNVGSASASSVGGGGGGGGSAPAPPQFNIVGQSSTNQLSQTIAGQQNRPIQTYVVGNQVSTQQSLDRNAVATSTFG